MKTPIITLAQQKGGAGKTTLAAHLSIAFQEFGLSVGMIDTDPQGSLSQWFAMRQKHIGPEEGFTCASTNGVRVQSTINAMACTHDVIVVDSPPRTETETRTAIRAADLVVVPLQPSPMDLWATHATLEMATRENTPSLLVLNRVNQNTTLAQTIRDSLEALSQNEIGNRVIFAATLLEGKGVLEVSPFSTAGHEIEELASEVLQHVGIEVEDTLHDHDETALAAV